MEGSDFTVKSQRGRDEALLEFHFCFETHSSTLGGVSVIPEYTCLLKEVWLWNHQICSPGDLRPCPLPSAPLQADLTGCGLRQSSQAPGSRGTNAQLGSAAGAGVVATAGETEKPLMGSKGYFLLKGERNHTFFWFQLLLQFLLAPEAEKHLLVSDLIIIKAKVVISSPFALPTALRGSRFRRLKAALSNQEGSGDGGWRQPGGALWHKQQGGRGDYPRQSPNRRQTRCRSYIIVKKFIKVKCAQS